MSIVIRILIAAAAFLVANVAVYLVDQNLGIERGSWRYAISIGIIIFITSYAWRLTAPTKQTPPQS